MVRTDKAMLEQCANGKIWLEKFKKWIEEISKFLIPYLQQNASEGLESEMCQTM